MRCARNVHRRILGALQPGRDRDRRHRRHQLPPDARLHIHRPDSDHGPERVRTVQRRAAYELPFPLRDLQPLHVPDPLSWQLRPRAQTGEGVRVQSAGFDRGGVPEAELRAGQQGEGLLDALRSRAARAHPDRADSSGGRRGERQSTVIEYELLN